MTQYRAHFDALVEFVNGGALTATGFRLDVPSATLEESAVARLFVQHLGLAMVGRVELNNFSVVEEQHKGSRGMRVESEQAMRRIVDLSQTIFAGLVTYPGLPAPMITPHLTREESKSHYAAGTEFAIDTITMVGNTGTYLDSPFHRYPNGDDLSEIDISNVVGLPAEVFHLTDMQDRGIPAEVFFDRELKGTAVLLHTGWDRHFGMEQYGKDAPYLTEAGARHLVDAGVMLVGIDSVNIDNTQSGGHRPAHSLLLGAEILVVEHLTSLDQLPAHGARFTAIPPKVRGFGTFPVRAFAEV